MFNPIVIFPESAISTPVPAVTLFHRKEILVEGVVPAKERPIPERPVIKISLNENKRQLTHQDIKKIEEGIDRRIKETDEKNRRFERFGKIFDGLNLFYIPNSGK